FFPDVELRRPLGVFHLPRNMRRRLDRPRQQLLGRQSAALHMIAIDDEPDAHHLGADRNEPEPRIAQHDDDGVAGIAAFAPQHVFVVREDRDLLQPRDVFLLPDALSDDRAVTARIDDEARFELLAVHATNDSAIRIVELDRRDAALFANLDALRRGVFQQQMIEVRALDLKRTVIARREIAVEMKRVADLAVAGQKLRAVLRRERAGRDLIGEAEAFEEIVVVGEERFADLKSREPLTLKERDGEPLLREERSGGRAAGSTAAADD